MNSITIARQIPHNSNDLTKYSENALRWHEAILVVFIRVHIFI